jgi:hypothetical protein
MGLIMNPMGMLGTFLEDSPLNLETVDAKS